jgi:hypothetical protein
MRNPKQIFFKLFKELYSTIDKNGIYEEDELIYQVRMLIQTLCHNNIELFKLTGCPDELVHKWKEVEKITLKKLKPKQ